MADLFTFECAGHTRANAGPAFDAVANAEDWAKWGKPIVLEAKFARTGTPDPRGIGAVRAMGGRPIFVKEEIIEFDPSHTIGYTLRTPAPLKDYRGHVTFTQTDSGTDIVWQGRFEELIPGSGPLLRKGLQRLIGFLLRQLVRHLDQHA